MEHEAEPAKNDQERIGANRVGFHGKAPHTDGQTRLSYPILRPLNYPFAEGTRPRRTVGGYRDVSRPQRILETSLGQRQRQGDSASRRVWRRHVLSALRYGNDVSTRGQIVTTLALMKRKKRKKTAPRGRLSLDNRGPSKEQLLMWERRPSRNVGKFLAVARPRSAINTLIRVRLSSV